MRRRAAAAGFTLLEVMVAVAILGLTLVVLLDVITRNVRATGHSRMTTIATFLARTKMADLENQVLELGFQDMDESKAGNFREAGFPDFYWEWTIQRIELPTDATQKAQSASGSQALSSGTKDPMQALTGVMSGMVGLFIEPVRVGLQESVRRINLRVYWYERGRPEQSFEVMTYLTDPARLDLAMGIPMGGVPNPQAGAGGASGSGQQQPPSNFGNLPGSGPR